MHKKQRPVVCEIPEKSVLFHERTDYDWFDAYQITVFDPDHALSPRKICDIFLDVCPFWVHWLFQVRNFFARLVGLHGVSSRKGVNLREYFDSLPLNEGDVVEKVEIFTHNNHELVAGMSDWHLAFKGSLFLTDSPKSPEKRSLTVVTVVKFRHFFGRIYFLPVKPFHKLIIQSLLRRTVRRLSTRPTSLKK